ncbi:hypothetical protein FPHYL_2621 [Fusarium phyllophilum]|uniref:Secreted protein CSS2 C-terminal domain-containing protein n=1 Tax=Fusarium phyllophilum TaxID=47803 RepID=A0A8H5K6U3_9HYPO|nr:hypothetical protein FPHYL_2621 [Fusarium phyllophilum]
MASQSSYELPPEWGLVPPNPDPDLTLPGDAIGRDLDRIDMPSLDVPISRIIGSTPLAFRPDVEIPELSEIDSETDEQPETPPDASTSYAGWNRTIKSDTPPLQRATIIGGAVVHNLCLVIPDDDINGFADLPVQPIRASKGQPAQLVAKILDDENEKPPMPFLILPDERRGGSDIQSADFTAMKRPATWSSSLFSPSKQTSGPMAWALSTLKAGGEPEEKKDEEGEKEKLGRSKMDEFVLSGDIDDFWGIKGLTAKLYKYKGPEKDAVDTPEETKEQEDKTGDETEQPSGKMMPLSDEPDTKPEDDRNDREEGGEEDDKDEPAREKIKLNTESFSLKGQPLGTLFPSINNFNIKNLPIENLELTYSEEKKNFLFKPGLRLEVDVLFKDNLAWAGDALKKLFGPNDPPKSIHLSAYLSDTRDWSKRPKIENLVLQGYFPPLALKAWDLLNFRTLGIEITATKAAENKPSEEEPEGDEHKDGKPEDQTDGNHENGGGEKETSKVANFYANEQKPDDDGGENEEEDDEEGSDDKAKDKKSWFFGFVFFGTVLITKVPHANVPLDVNYRIARDFVAAEEGKKEEDNKEDDGDDEAADDEGGQGGVKEKSVLTMDEGTKEDDKKGGEDGKRGKEPDKKNETSKHKRNWNLLIKPDKWENIYGIENVTMKDAELKASFEEGDFRSTVKLELSAELKLGDGTFKVQGQISRDDNFLEAEIAGHKLPEKEMKKSDDEKKADEKKTSGGNEITFKEMKLKLSSKKSKEEKTTRKALELNGKVTFNEHSSAVGSLTFASEGVTVQGGISDVKIPDTEITIKKAGLEIFFGFKSKKSEEKPDENSGDDKKESKPTGENKSERPGKDENGEVVQKSLVKSGDEPPSQTPSEKEEKDNKTKKVKRGNRFGILGVVEINKVTIKVGLYTEQKKDKEKREWLAFGAVENIRLREIWNAIPEDNFLNLELRNIALIASSHERKKKKKDDETEDEDDDEKKEKADGEKEKSDEVKTKTIKNKVSDGEVWINSLDVFTVTEEKPDGDSKGEEGDGDEDKKEDSEEDEEEQEEPDNWDVLGTVDAYNYPVVKGLQLCATIPSFPQLEELNGKKKLEGLTLILSITSNGKLSATIDLPESFRLQLSDTAYLHSFGTTIAIKSSTGPELNIHATLTLTFKDSDPISVEGVIVGSFKGARGELKMSAESKWVNPFGLNKNMVFSQLGFGTGFTYATVLVTGPDEIALRGQVDIGKFRAKLDMGLRVTSAEAVFQLEMNKLDAMEIVQLAGVLIDNQAMQQMKGAEGKLVFKDLKLYVSSGAEFLGRYYDRGIQVQGKMWCFGKKGEFDGRFDESGVVIKAGIDNFKVGGLEITSTQEGVDRATMDIEMTKDRQKLFIDGRIRYYGLEISVFLDLDIQQQYLKLDVKIKLTESLLLSLKADVVVKNHNSLEGAEMSFEAILETDILGVILQGITDGIDALHKLADKAINDARSDLTKRLAQKEAALKAMKNELDKLEKECTAETLKKQEEIDEENKLLRGLHDEFEKYAEAYRKAKEAKDQNAKEIHRLEHQRDEARRKLGEKKTEIKKKYDEEIKKERAKRDAMEREKKRLIDSRDASWGDALRSYREADRSWQWWCRLEEERYAWKRTCESKLYWCAWYDKPYWTIKLTEATLGLEEAHARKTVDAELRHAGKAIMDLPAFRSIEAAINEAARKIDQFGRAIDGLVNRGLGAYLEEMLKDEREDLNRQIRLLDALMRKSEELEAAYEEAKKALDKTEQRLSPKQEAARKRIAEIQAEIRMLPARHEYMNKKKDYETMEIQVNYIVATLDDIQRVMKEVSQISKDVINTLKKGIPRVTKIIVRASNRSFVDDKPLMFEIQAVWMEKQGTFHVEWAPNQGISVLYSQAAEKLATWRLEDELPALPAPTPQPDPTPQDPKPEPQDPKPVPKDPKLEPQDPAHKAKIHLIHRGANNDADWPYWSTFDGQTWSRDHKVWSWGLHISDGLCLSSFQKKLFIFHLNPQNHTSRVFYESYASGAWTRGATTMIPNTVTSPGMCAVTFQGKLYLFHHGIPQEKLRYNVFDGRRWEGDTDINIDDVRVGFTAIVFSDKIYLFYLVKYGPSSARYSYVAFDGTRWEKERTLLRAATSGVTAAVYRNKLYLIHRGYVGAEFRQLWYNVFDGVRWITFSKETGAMRIPDCDDVEGDISSVVYEDKMMQILVLGLPRTGTQSLADALEILGISPIYHMREVGKNNHADLWTALLYEKFSTDGFSQPPGDLLKILSNYKGVSDYPAAIFVDELLAAYPEAAVILTVRSEDSWAKSMKDTIVHYLDNRVIDETTPMAVMSRTYSKFCWDNDFEKNGLDLFRRHNEQVRLVTKERKFLEYTVPVPENIPYPRKDDWLEYKKQIHKRRRSYHTHIIRIMVNLSKTWVTCLAFGLVEPSLGLHDKQGQRVGYNPLVKQWNGPDSNLTATLDLVDPGHVSVFEKRRHIDVTAWATVALAAGTTILAAEAGMNIYKQVADIIKSKSNHNSCSMTTGTNSNGHIIEGYAYLATTSGHDCKTTAETKTILAAVKDCADWQHKHGAIMGCCVLSHGGTWKGHLRLTSQPNKYPAHAVNCD